MGLLSLYFMAFLPLSHAADLNPWDSRWKSLNQLVRVLESVPEGRKVIKEARARDLEIFAKIKRGSASYTESTFTRTFSLVDGKERITLHHEVTLNRDLNLADAAVDLAHELVHFTQKGVLDPYQPGFELGHFIRNGIEGPGGELTALTVECHVAWALGAKFESFPTHRLCERYRKQGSRFDRESARLDYYAVGHFDGKTFDTLHRVLPELNHDASVFTSSYAGRPYPVALAEEYVATRQAACANNRRKYRLIASQSTSARQPAATTLKKETVLLQDYERRFCHDVKPSKDSSDDPH